MSRHSPYGLRNRILGLWSVFLLLVVTCSEVASGAAGDPTPAVAMKPGRVKVDHARDPVFSKPAPENIADLRAIENRVKKLAKQLTQCTVGLRVGAAQGSGVIVSKDGYVLTAAHVVGTPGRSVTFVLADGRTVQGKSLGLDRSVDAAMLKITDVGEWPYAEMGNAEDLRIGDWCIATGHPGGYKTGRAPVVRLGRIVVPRNSRSTLVQTDCTLVGGDSGGPLFDVEGRVIGIHSRIGAPTMWNFHVPISTYRKNWDRLLVADEWSNRPTPGTAYLGIGGEDVENGCRLTEVGPGLPAESAGLQVGDVIVRFDGRPVTCFRDLAAAIRKKKPGDEVTVEILRGGETIRKTATLTKWR